MDSEIVITGMSGRFPESENVDEFRINLFAKVDMVTEDNRRWVPGIYGTTRRMGKLKEIGKFDNRFFGLHNKQANHLDPQARILLEVAHETILDAGYDPEELRGKNIGVYIGCSASESNEIFGRNHKTVDGYTMIGCSCSTFANRISYTYDFKGPSLTIDTACSSAATALFHAVLAIKSGICEAAIVGGANICINPITLLRFSKLNVISDDGTSRSFDADGKGYVRSEAVTTIFLQKANVARRVYASVINVGMNTDGFKPEGPTFPSTEMQRKLMQRVYEECQLDPLKISYVETHGAGTPAGDPVEIAAIANIFCRGRKEPLLVGSVKSNMGHSEAASAICGIVKVLLAMESGRIPPNLHFNRPNPDIPTLLDGRVKVVTEPTPWNGRYAATCSTGFGGVNVHTVLKANPRQREATRDEEKSRLVLYCGRTGKALQGVFEHIKLHKPPAEFYALIDKTAYVSARAMPFRGYRIVNNPVNVEVVEQVDFKARPLWFAFSGMGSQWPGMAKSLMDMEVFAKSIRRSADVLRPYDIDLVDFVTNGIKDDVKPRTTIPAFVSIAAVQIALVDVLKELGLSPDGIVGHSVGELGCAYADGCFTAEQMILASYWRGKVVDDSKLENGAMAAIGLTWSEASKRCPSGIYPSCHNAEDLVTISGPAEEVKLFVNELKEENIFAKEVDSCGYAFHSRYILPVAENLQTALETVIPNPKQRTQRWISSSYPEEEEPKSRLADASYFVHNLVSPVLFHEALKAVPKHAIVIEIGPHHLLQAILKRVIGPDAKYIGLMRKNTDNRSHLFANIGELYVAGLNPIIEKLFPRVELPVPRGTPMISPLIKWDHSESWTVANWDNMRNASQISTEVNVGTEDSPDHYILDHNIGGRYLYPAAGYLLLVWKGLAEMKRTPIDALPVTFENVKIHRFSELSKTHTTRFLVDITTVGGEFEISEGGVTVVTGQICAHSGNATSEAQKYWQDINQEVKLHPRDIYKELKLRGYDYGPSFQGIIESDLQRHQGLLKWTGDWIVFVDTMLQFCFLSTSNRGLFLPTEIKYLKINPLLHNQYVKNTLKDCEGVPIVHGKCSGKFIAGGVELKHVNVSVAPRQPCKQEPILEEYRFVPYNQPQALPQSTQEIIEKYIQVCSCVSRKIFKSAGGNKDQIKDVMNYFDEADELLIESYVKSNSKNHVLLTALCSITENTDDKDFALCVKNSLDSYLCERNNDILSQSLLSDIPLRNIVDVVIENLTSRTMEVAEMSDSQIPFCNFIDKVIRDNPTIKVNYSLAHLNSEALDRTALPATNIQLTSQNTASDMEFRGADLLALKYMGSNKTELKQLLKQCSEAIKHGGFILLLQRTRLIPAEMFLSAAGGTHIPTHSEADLEHMFDELNLNVICKKSDSFASTMYLVRKSVTSYEDSVVYISDKFDEWVDVLKDEIVDASIAASTKRIWLVSEGSCISGIIGLVNCLRHESCGENIRCVFINGEAKHNPKFILENSFYRNVAKNDLVMNVFRNGIWGSYRHILKIDDNNKIQTKHAYLKVMTRGDFSSFTWIHSPLKYFSPKQQKQSVLCHVYYAALNFKDIMLASGKLLPDAIPGDLALQDSILGLEFSGGLGNGERVMGMVPAKGLATVVAADPDFLWKVPDSWTLQEASTVPIAYSTAYYALVVRGNLQKGESILIHSGSGDVGQAAIAVAFHIGCEVFTSVGNEEKRGFLKKRFPQLKERNFCNSRDISFESHVLCETNGKGVDAILNSLADEKLKASLNCLAKHGRFLEIGKYDMANNNSLGMDIFIKNISFHGIMVDSFWGDQKIDVQIKNKELTKMVKEGIINGTVKPLNSIVFNHDQAEHAFRYMASGRHIGKVVLKIREKEARRQVTPTPVKVEALLRTYCDPGKVYIIIGGLGGIGLELCQWLVERGATKVVLTSRSGIRSGYQHLRIKTWREKSLNIITSSLNVSKFDEAKLLLTSSAKYGEIAAIFNLALVLKDAFMENQTVKFFQEVCESKVTSTKNLDILSRELCPHLDWFVCFSSMNCGKGSAGQSNYGYANSVMERVCEERYKEGYPGLAIQWGLVGDVGLVEDTMGSDVVRNGTVPQSIISCLSVLDNLLQQKQKHPVVSSHVLYRSAESGSRKTKNNALATAYNIFGIKDASSIKPEMTLGELGMDSLMGVEVKQFLERDYELLLSIPELRQLSIGDIMKLDNDINTTQETNDDKKPSINVSNEFSFRVVTEIIPKETLVTLNSIKTGVPLFIIHPVDGTVTMLKQMSELIPCPVFGLQFTPGTPYDSVEHVAGHYWKFITENKELKEVHLAGYSFGACIAFEMSLQAQQKQNEHPVIKSVIMLDGSHTITTSITRECEACYTQNPQIEGEVEVLLNFLLQFTVEDIKKLKKEMMKLSSYNERVQHIAKKIAAANKGLSLDDIGTAIDLYYHNILIAFKYAPKCSLEHDIILIKPSEKHETAKGLSKCYDLDKVCNGKINVFTVTGTHTTFIKNGGAEEAAKIITENI